MNLNQLERVPSRAHGILELAGLSAQDRADLEAGRGLRAHNREAGRSWGADTWELELGKASLVSGEQDRAIGQSVRDCLDGSASHGLQIQYRHPDLANEPWKVQAHGETAQGRTLPTALRRLARKLRMEVTDRDPLPFPEDYESDPVHERRRY